MNLTPIGEWRGRAVVQCTLASTAGVEIDIINWGAVVRDWRLPIERHEPRSVVLGFERFEPYPLHSPSFGAICGRVANRIAHGRFRLGDDDCQLPRNNGRHHLHGGPEGFGRVTWTIDTDEVNNAVELRYSSPHGDAGYPGRLDVCVVYRLLDYRLDIEMTAVPDRPTPVNLAHHSYFNLSGADQIGGHRLWLNADRYTPVDGELIPTGAIDSVAGSPFDFRRERQLTNDNECAFDTNLVLVDDRDAAMPVARLTSPDWLLQLRQWTDQPAVQLFSAGGIDVPVAGHAGRRYGPFCGLCLEAQHFPDSVNQPHFPSVIATPDAPYVQKTAYEISPPAARS